MKTENKYFYWDLLLSKPLPNLKVQFPEFLSGNDCMFLYNSTFTGVLSVQEVEVKFGRFD